MKFITLTDFETSKPVTVNFDQVTHYQVYEYRQKPYTAVFVVATLSTGQCSVNVSETPDDIDRMLKENK